MSESFINGLASGFAGGVAGVMVFLAGWSRLEKRAQAKRKREWETMVSRYMERRGHE